MAPYVGQVLTRPRWLAGFLGDGGLMRFPNVVLPGQGAMAYADAMAALEHSVVSWPDLKWIREVWRGPIVIKGVMIAEDARRAVDEGVDAIVVSNHGGRQLDGVAATLRALPEVVAAAGGGVEVLFDGGIRRGSDIVKALALGARAVLIGRAYAYGLGAGGGPGVQRTIDILRSDLVRTLKLLGCPSTAALDRSYIETPGNAAATSSRISGSTQFQRRSSRRREATKARRLRVVRDGTLVQTTALLPRCHETTKQIHSDCSSRMRDGTGP